MCGLPTSWTNQNKDFKFIEIGIWEDGSCAAHDIGYANNAEIDKYGELNAKLKVDHDIGLFKTKYVTFKPNNFEKYFILHSKVYINVLL